MIVGQTMAFGGKYQAEDVRLPAKVMGLQLTFVGYLHYLAATANSTSVQFCSWRANPSATAAVITIAL